MELNQVKIQQSFEKNASGYCVYEVNVDGKIYYAARSEQHGTWKVCNEINVTTQSRNIPLWINRKNCGIHLISLLERMLLAKTNYWEGPLPRILGRGL